ncbi:hypothetical protein PUNSTDRAFT_70405 [Punctularia strigosozonata HHB-11173 SS5]|uniref:uncharacterized protein n=1 Tax=Punctularia strigosozonata (strain HHB-11173) TaxID=741275 RepID=UPI0004417865|nr:uncharacterized protein PUNSTDRAFT_70405 [Punctularia strigosozonata HHB-11173 SS5]EIN08057.1 hypothetical protein PUNSTDRAFT_70405 [Punctularia strigosozonata HHB-11173 SS5]
MAAPAEVTTAALAGVYVLNKKMSDNTMTDNILQLQGVGRISRDAHALRETLYRVKHYTDGNGVEHLDVDKKIGGLERDRESPLFGHVIGKTRRDQVEDLEDALLKEGWHPDTHCAIESIALRYCLDYACGLIDPSARSRTARLTFRQSCCFKVINGERRYTRSMKFTGPKGENVEARVWYDYIEPV